MTYISFDEGSGLVTDEYFMNEALKEAQKAFELDEVPIGAVIVYKNRIIARGHNLSETLNDTTAHAEMQAFTSATNHVGGKYLQQCTLYVTLEPCLMCAGAAFWTQIGRIVYGAKDEKRGYSKFDNDKSIIHPKTTVLAGILEERCASFIKRFFQKKRN